MIKNPFNYSNLALLLASKQNVFSLGDLSLIWGESNRILVSDLAGWYVDSGKFFKIKTGLFSLLDPLTQKNLNYQLSIAQKLVSPSYISYHTVLAESGVNFQYYNSIHSCGLINKKFKVADQDFIYHKIEAEIFYNPLGIIKNQFGLDQACIERAICDSWYINSGLGLDNIENINLELLLELAIIYNKSRIWKNLKSVFGIKKPQYAQP